MRSREEDYPKRYPSKQAGNLKKGAGVKRKGMWISLPASVMVQVDVIVRASPLKEDGSRIFRKDVIEQAVKEYVAQFDGADEIKRIFGDMQESLAEEHGA